MRQQPTRDAFHFLEKQQLVVNLSLRTGHCRLNSHLKKKAEVGAIPYLLLWS